MIVITFGPPSAFTQWSVHALSAMSSVVFGEFDYVSVSTVQDFRTALSNRQKPHMNFFTDSPDQGLVEAFQKTRLPFLVLSEDPADVTGFIMRERSMDWKQAIRLANMTFAATAELVTSPMALRISRTANLTIGQFLQRVAKHLRTELTQAQLDVIIRRLIHDGNASSLMEEALLSQIVHAQPIGQGLDVSDEAARIMEPLLHAMRLTPNGPATSFRWPRELFVGAAGLDELLEQPINMVGPARCLVYGPYLYLPFGYWETSLVLEVEENFSGNTVDIDVVHGTVLQLETFKLPKEGRMGLITRFLVKESRTPIEIRVIQREGAIEGLLQIGDVEIRRVAETDFGQAI